MDLLASRGTRRLKERRAIEEVLEQWVDQGSTDSLEFLEYRGTPGTLGTLAPPASMAPRERKGTAVFQVFEERQSGTIDT